MVRFEGVYTLGQLRSLAREHNNKIKEEKHYLVNAAKASRSVLESFINKHFNSEEEQSNVANEVRHNFRSKVNDIGINKQLRRKGGAGRGRGGIEGRARGRGGRGRGGRARGGRGRGRARGRGRGRARGAQQLPEVDERRMTHHEANFSAGAYDRKMMAAFKKSKTSFKPIHPKPNVSAARVRKVSDNVFTQYTPGEMETCRITITLLQRN